MSDELVSIREFARRVGVSDTAVLKAVKAGKIAAECLDHTNPKRPKIYPLAALKSWGKNYAPNWSQSPALDKTINEMAELGTVEAPAATEDYNSPADQGETATLDEDEESDRIRLKKNATLNEAKRVEAIAQAKLAQVKLAEQKGRLVLKEKIYKQFYDVGIRVRSALQGIPDKVIDNLLACDTRNEAHALLYNAITEALESLAVNPDDL